MFGKWSSLTVGITLRVMLPGARRASTTMLHSASYGRTADSETIIQGR
jgi:hypothetical protein